MAEDRPESCHHYEDIDEVPEDIQKYWQQRYDIFSRYDEGVWLTDIAWYGVTPEPIAHKIASYVAGAAPTGKDTLVDAFAGVGGNTIAFALSGRWKRIFAIEQDPDTIKCARHNAKLYGVEHLISFVTADSFKVMKKRFQCMQESVVIFASPPWGGPGYREDYVFNVDRMEPYGLSTLYDYFSSITDEFVLYLPRTSNLQQVARYAEKGEKKLAVIHYCMSGASKALCVYFGKLSPG